MMTIDETYLTLVLTRVDSLHAALEPSITPDVEGRLNELRDAIVSCRGTGPAVLGVGRLGESFALAIHPRLGER